MAILVAATLYGVGKTFFWPTMLGVVSEQTPKGGALTLNAISGIGMLAVGTLGFPYIGVLQSGKEIKALVADADLTKKVPGLVANGKLTVIEEKTTYEVIPYETISKDKLDKALSSLEPAVRDAANENIQKLRDQSKQGALLDMAMFPAFMLVCYLILLGYFMSRGGYKPVEMHKEHNLTASGRVINDKFKTLNNG